MFYALLILATSAIASSLSHDEVLDSVLGTSNPTTIARMMQNPQAYWAERKASLFRGAQLKRHPEFLDIFIQQTKARCEELLKSSTQKCLTYTLDQFETCVKEAFADDLQQQKGAMASYYAMLCDHILSIKTNHRRGARSWILDTAEDFRSFLMGLPQAPRHRAYKIMIWTFTNDRAVSMLDYLIVLSENLHLCSIAADTHMRDNFEADYGLYQNHSGALYYNISRAKSVLLFFQVFANHGLNAGSYIQELFSTQDKHNLFDFCKKVLTTFANTYGFTPQREDDPLESVLSPEITLLPKRLRETIPFFMDGNKEGYPSEDAMIQALIAWREQYAGDINTQHLKKSVKCEVTLSTQTPAKQTSPEHP